MATVEEIIQIAEYSQTLAAVDVASSGLYGGGVDLLLPRKLYMVRKNVEREYTLNPSSESLTATSNYLYALCGKNGLIAQREIGVSGGSVAPVTPGGGGASDFPIYITNSDFDNATQYVDDRLTAENIIVYLNEINRYLIPGVETSLSGDTLTIMLPGFDATSNVYNLVIENYSGAS